MVVQVYMGACFWLKVEQDILMQAVLLASVLVVPDLSYQLKHPINIDNYVTMRNSVLSIILNARQFTNFNSA